jgi:hypothetical protein
VDNVLVHDICDLSNVYLEKDPTRQYKLFVSLIVLNFKMFVLRAYP